MNDTTRLLCAISCTEPSTFSEVLRGLGDDRPEDRAEWRVFFLTLESFEESGLVTIERLHDRIDSLQLTALGAERVREVQKHHG